MPEPPLPRCCEPCGPLMGADSHQPGLGLGVENSVGAGAGGVVRYFRKPGRDLPLTCKVTRAQWAGRSLRLGPGCRRSSVVPPVWLAQCHPVFLLLHIFLVDQSY